MLSFFSFLLLFLVMWAAMWAFFKFMYPKPPREFMPKKGDIITPRKCSYCDYPLAEYRGVLEHKPESSLNADELNEVKKLDLEVDRLQSAIDASESQQKSGYEGMTRKEQKQAKAELDKMRLQLFKNKQAVKNITTWFFCNYEHQASFHNQQNVHEK